MTEPKLKPCPWCDGKGKKYLQVFNETMECAYCNGTGKLPMTNEEWFCGLSTEEKAKFFKDISEKCLSCGAVVDYDEVGECPFGRCRTGINEYEEWLKEKHE